MLLISYNNGAAAYINPAVNNYFKVTPNTVVSPARTGKIGKLEELELSGKVKDLHSPTASANLAKVYDNATKTAKEIKEQHSRETKKFMENYKTHF